MKTTVKALCSIVAALLVFGAGTAPASTPTPTIYASAIVDGDPSEWNLPQDFFSNMYRAGDPSKPLESKLYLRYDCQTQTMFALVLAQPGIPCLLDAGTAWIAIDAINNKVVLDSSGDNGVAPDFAWIGVGFDSDQNHAQGYEASFPLAPGTYEILCHVQVFDGGSGQTSATPGHPHDGAEIVVACTPLATEHSTWSAVKSLYR